MLVLNQSTLVKGPDGWSLLFSANHTVLATQTSSYSVTPTISAKQPSFEQSPCNLAPVNSVETYPDLQPSTDADPALFNEVTSVLFDDDFTTCMRPFQFHSLLRLALDTPTTMGPSLLRFQIVGEGLDCIQPSTLVYLYLSEIAGSETLKRNINRQECPSMQSNPNTDLVTCTYECQPLLPFNGSVRFGVEVQRLSWLARSQHLQQLCDIRVFIWI